MSNNSNLYQYSKQDFLKQQIKKYQAKLQEPNISDDEHWLNHKLWLQYKSELSQITNKVEHLFTTDATINLKEGWDDEGEQYYIFHFEKMETFDPYPCCFSAVIMAANVREAIKIIDCQLYKPDNQSELASAVTEEFLEQYVTCFPMQKDRKFHDAYSILSFEIHSQGFETETHRKPNGVAPTNI